MEITNELLKAYAMNNVSQEERLAVRQYLTENPKEIESVFAMMDDDEDFDREHDGGFINRLDELIEEIDIRQNSGDFDILPMTAMAAENSVDALCAIRCEGIALRNSGFDISDEELIEESKANGWLQDEGTALHNISRLSGSRGLSVVHRYDCTFEDIETELYNGKIVIAVVDSGELTGDLDFEQYEDEAIGQFPDHAVIIVNITDEEITILDSATPQDFDNYPRAQFADAWADSMNYLITISGDDDYEPHPIDLSDVDISDDLIELREAIAENAHEVWAANRKREGWTYGPVRDDEKKQHPDMIAYNRLPECEKLYDREMAINTIKLVKKLGYDIIKR